MSELSTKALAILRSQSSEKKTFTSTDLTVVGFSFLEAKQAITELEECGYIEVNRRWIQHPFVLV